MEAPGKFQRPEDRFRHMKTTTGINGDLRKSRFLGIQLYLSGPPSFKFRKRPKPRHMILTVTSFFGFLIFKFLNTPTHKHGLLN